MKAQKLPYLTEVKNSKETKGLNFLQTYTTKNYSIFHKMVENRGAENSVEPKRVAEFLSLTTDDKFVVEDCHVRCNILMKVIDGHNKLARAEKLNAYVNFMIVPDKMFNNVSDRDFANNVSLYNAIDSSWRDRSNLASAIRSGERCAVNIMKLIVGVNNLKMFAKNPLSPTRVINIVTNFEKGIIDRKQLREVYCNDGYADIMESAEFKAKFDGIVDFMLIISRANKNIRAYGVIRQLLIDLKNISTSPDWSVINAMLLKYIAKDKDFDKMGDRGSDFKTISKGVVAMLVK